MQKKLHLFSALLFISLTSVKAQSEAEIKTYPLKAGDVLTYELISQGKKYELILQFTSVPDDNFDFGKLAFNWSKTGNNETKTGKVKFSGGEMAHSYLYDLSVTSSFSVDFEKVNLAGIFTSQGLWLSAKAQMDYLLGGEFGINMMNDEQATIYKPVGQYYYDNTTLYGNPCRITVDKFVSTANEKSFMMVQSLDQNPLILAVYIAEKDFFISLKKIEQDKVNAVTDQPATQPVKSAESLPAAKPDSDQDGIPDDIDKCKDEREDKDSFEDSDGCPEKDNDNDGIDDMYDQCPNTKGSTDNGGCPQKQNNSGDNPWY